MTVYVGPAAWEYRGQKYCHVWADSEAELHRAAEAAGLRREWFQAPPKASWKHYDAAPRLRAVLVANGAVQTDRYGPAEHEARRTGDQATLDRIAKARALRTAPAAAGPVFMPCDHPGCRDFGSLGFGHATRRTRHYCYAHRADGERAA